MTALAAYRDDGPLAGWVVRAVRRRAPRERRGPTVSWVVPPLLRVLEYSTLITITALTDPDALPSCYALLAVLAFRHYDTAYRLQHQHAAPPAWLGAVGGGWEGRLIAAGVLAAAGELRIGLLAAAVGLGVVFVTESAASWVRFLRTAEATFDERGVDAYDELGE